MTESQRDAAAALHGLTRAAALRAAYRLRLDPQDALSEAQEALCEAVVAWRPGGATIERYVLWVVHQAMIDLRKASNVRENAIRVNHAIQPDEIAPRAHWDPLEALPDHLVPIARMRWQEGMTPRQIARVTGRKPDLVNRLLEKAESIIRECIYE